MEPKFITTGTKVLTLLVPKGLSDFGMSFCHEAPGCRRRSYVREEWTLDARPRNEGAKRLDLLNSDLATWRSPSDRLKAAYKFNLLQWFWREKITAAGPGDRGPVG
jgi:hypothetical protein